MLGTLVEDQLADLLLSLLLRLAGVHVYFYDLTYGCFLNVCLLALAALGPHCCTQASSSCGERGLLSSYTAWASPHSGFPCTGSRRAGFSTCGTRAQQLWLEGLVAPQQVGPSGTKD